MNIHFMDILVGVAALENINIYNDAFSFNRCSLQERSHCGPQNNARQTEAKQS